MDAARFYTHDMAQDNYFEPDHATYDRIDGELVYICDAAVRVQSYYTQGVFIGENGLAGFQTPEDAVNGWMNSPGHRANILASYHREMGASLNQGYGILDFGATTVDYLAIINREAAITYDPNVSLYI